MIFEPQPLEYFLGDNAPSRLMCLREKVIEFAKLPVDSLLIVRFNRYFANCDAEQFIDDILINKLNVKHLVIGMIFILVRRDVAILPCSGKRANIMVLVLKIPGLTR